MREIEDRLGRAVRRIGWIKGVTRRANIHWKR